MLIRKNSSKGETHIRKSTENQQFVIKPFRYAKLSLLDIRYVDLLNMTYVRYTFVKYIIRYTEYDVLKSLKYSVYL